MENNKFKAILYLIVIYLPIIYFVWYFDKMFINWVFNGNFDTHGMPANWMFLPNPTNYINLTNYTIRMDNGAFRFAFSSAATRLDYGTEQATIDYAGNIAAQANVSAGRNVYATKDVLAGNSMYSVHDIGAGGTISAAGDVIAYQTSDITYKTNIVNIPNALEKLNQINGIEFDWSDEYISSKGGEDGYFIRKHDVGVIAQEIEAVLPEVVATRGDGTKAVRYEKIIALLIEAVKDLSSQVNELKKKN